MRRRTPSYTLFFGCPFCPAGASSARVFLALAELAQRVVDDGGSESISANNSGPPQHAPGGASHSCARVRAWRDLPWGLGHPWGRHEQAVNRPTLTVGWCAFFRC